MSSLPNFILLGECHASNSNCREVHHSLVFLSNRKLKFYGLHAKWRTCKVRKKQFILLYQTSNRSYIWAFISRDHHSNKTGAHCTLPPRLERSLNVFSSSCTVVIIGKARHAVGTTMPFEGFCHNVHWPNYILVSLRGGFIQNHAC